MTIWPKSLGGRTWASTVLIMIAAQLITTTLFGTLILRPETERVAGLMAQSVVTTSDTLAALPPAERARAIDRLRTSPYLEIWSGTVPPDDGGPPPRAIERTFMKALAKAMSGQGDLYWRTDHNRKLWIHVQLGGAPYWISVKSPPLLGPTGVFALSGLSMVLLAALAAWLVGRRVLRPLAELQATTETYRPGAGAMALREDGPDEIAAVARSFNRMTQRLARNDAERSLILAGISHDVRTPLAKLKLAFEMMPRTDDELRASAQRQIDSIDRILSQFMTFARGFEAETVGQVVPQRLMDEALATYGDHGVIALSGPVAAPFAGRPEALRRAFANLIENAIRYGAGPIEISITGADHVRLAVRDHGPGVAPDTLDQLADPFFRGDVARQPKASDLPTSGTGLGLAIAERVARLHDSRLVLANRDDGFEASLDIAVKSS